MAINVARREGVNRTARELHLDAGKLKRLLVAADARQHKGRKRHRRTGICRTHLTGADRRPWLRNRVRNSQREQNAHILEDGRPAGLDGSAARLAGCRAMIQITAQMRVLVAIETVDGRKGIDRELAANPPEWMPWNYRETIARAEV